MVTISIHDPQEAVHNVTRKTAEHHAWITISTKIAQVDFHFNSDEEVDKFISDLVEAANE
jgi:hypothetical protein